LFQKLHSFICRRKVEEEEEDEEEMATMIP
jgi:hypothetical protein